MRNTDEALANFCKERFTYLEFISQMNAVGYMLEEPECMLALYEGKIADVRKIVTVGEAFLRIGWESRRLEKPIKNVLRHMHDNVFVINRIESVFYREKPGTLLALVDEAELSLRIYDRGDADPSGSFAQLLQMKEGAEGYNAVMHLLRGPVIDYKSYVVTDPAAYCISLGQR